LPSGAAGSIGSELAKQMAILKPKKLVCFDWWENGIFELKKNLKQYGFSEIEYIIGNIQDKIKVDQVIAIHKPDVIFHAAAYKHVPLMEENIEEAVKNNVIGTENLAETAIKHQVKDFILISSDKAINPSSVMGATKRITEKLMYLYANKDSTRFTGVRFGNVLLSNGSVIPLFEEQIKKGGPVTITDPEMVRYFMTIEEAVQLVIQSWTLGENGEIFVLDMGEPIKIKDLANNLIMAYGYFPNKDIEIKITGSRPGEKLFEEIVLDKEKVTKTKHDKIFVVQKEEEFDFQNFLGQLKQLKLSVFEPQINKQEILNQIKALVPNFNPKK
jgi:FlaA1/EpsC-like NDP-sugar epimerase